MIQAIVYDAVGTLIHVEPAVGAIYAEVGRRFGSRLEAGQIRRRFHAAFGQQDELDERAGWRTSEAREVERWRAIVGAVLDDVADPAACFAALYDRFARPDVWRCHADAAELLAGLHARGIRQALASNFDTRLRGVMDALPIARFLDPLVISSEVGWRKPAAAFFRHVVAALELPPAEILFVGDDRGNDYDAARAAGLQARLLDPDGRHLDLGPDRIERLADVLNLV
jgi:putative hydrolase of the HAD superfamily